VRQQDDGDDDKFPQRLSLGKRAAETYRRWPGLRLATMAFLVLATVLVVQNTLLALTAEPLQLVITATHDTVIIDGQTLTFPHQGAPDAVLFAAPDPLTREFQIDGTDSANNFSLDPAYFARIASTPYYRFQTWMRDSRSYSSWRDVVASDATLTARPDGSMLVTLARSSSPARFINATLLRPETPSHIYLRCGGATCGEIIIDRNDRYVLARDLTADGAASNEQRIFFPESPLPFLAEVGYLLAQVALWSLILLLAALALMGLFALAAAPVQQFARQSMASGGLRFTWLAAPLRGWLRLPTRLAALGRRIGSDRWDGLAVVTVLASLGYTLWVALAQFQAQPHILDASAYFFQAKIFASGHLSAPVPADPGAFQGPFMVARDGRWFAQYPPMTSLLLAVGVALHAPWLVEPLLGTLALWGVFRLGRRFYSGAVAWLATLLGALSPFYTYLAASYMSHTVALFFAVYFLLLLVRFTQEWRWYDLPLAAVFAVGLLLTREFSAALIGVVATAFLFGVQWRALRQRIATLWPVFCLALSILVSGVILYLLYNTLQTGSPTLTPREVFFPGDRYGFGQGIGFYGQHTFAAGMVILDQLLTILLIDLYGWPFYLTLALLPLTFVRREAGARWDIFCVLLLVLLVGAQAGYFYHGIYLGPRYLFETLPFLLLLTARGVGGLAAVLARSGHALGGGRGTWGMRDMRCLGLTTSGALLLALLTCNLLYYTPRQTQIYKDYTGLPATMKVDAWTLYAFHPPQGIVVTNNWFIYNYILWPLNDPTLQGKTLYAYAPTPDVMRRLHTEFPNRTFYLVQVAPSGAVTFVAV
jgi:hypothetical protein